MYLLIDILNIQIYVWQLELWIQGSVTKPRRFRYKHFGKKSHVKNAGLEKKTEFRYSVLRKPNFDKNNEDKKLLEKFHIAENCENAFRLWAF